VQFHNYKNKKIKAHETKGADGSVTVIINSVGIRVETHDEQESSFPTGLLQMWQIEKCSQLIQKTEKLKGFRYARVARIRTDAVAKTPAGHGSRELGYCQEKMSDLASDAPICYKNAGSLLSKHVL
jgi:hypothetical protein